ncbi:MAG TPA: glycosyltransferase [Thermoanaerobaculia bacterium]
MIRELVALLIAPATLDGFARALLALAAARPTVERELTQPRRWLVVIPARDEGTGVRDTIASVNAAALNSNVRTILLLDGNDAEAAAVAHETRIEVFVKEPAGPSKGAALEWLSRQPAARLDESDAVLLLDVGSEVNVRFFDGFRWPAGSDAGQVFLRSGGIDVGEGAAASERLAQSGEDRGRERLGWAVRLRGTGTVLTPESFRVLSPRLRTQVEDEEATLVLSSLGRTVTLARGEAFVIDEKPARWRSAAGQRARWLAGRMLLFVRQPLAMLRLIARKPAEGLVFVLDLFGRPLSLSVPLRILAGGGLVIASLMTKSAVWTGWLGTAAVVSGLLDLVHVSRSGVSVRSAATMVLAWIGAVLLAPRALLRWIKARDRRS